MTNIKTYKKNAFKTTDANGKNIFAECDEKSASEMNRLEWNEENAERARNKPIKRKDSEGKLMEFDPKADSRECSYDELVSLGKEPQQGFEEGFEDMVIEKVFSENRMGILYNIFPTLSDEDRHIIIAEMNGISSREYEKRYRTPRTTYLYRREKLFRRLRNLIEDREREKGHSRM